MTKKPEAQAGRPTDRLTGQSRADFIQVLITKGLRGQDLSSRIREGMTRREAAEALAQSLRTLPKAR